MREPCRLKSMFYLDFVSSSLFRIVFASMSHFGGNDPVTELRV